VVQPECLSAYKPDQPVFLSWSQRTQDCMLATSWLYNTLNNMQQPSPLLHIYPRCCAPLPTCCNPSDGTCPVEHTTALGQSQACTTALYAVWWCQCAHRRRRNSQAGCSSSHDRMKVSLYRLSTPIYLIFSRLSTLLLACAHHAWPSQVVALTLGQCSCQGWPEAALCQHTMRCVQEAPRSPTPDPYRTNSR